jgi:hypothetical protein
MKSAISAWDQPFTPQVDGDTLPVGERTEGVHLLPGSDDIRVTSRIEATPA